MSRIGITLGFILSLAAHVLLLWSAPPTVAPDAAAASSPGEPAAVEVVPVRREPAREPRRPAPPPKPADAAPSPPPAPEAEPEPAPPNPPMAPTHQPPPARDEKAGGDFAGRAADAPATPALRIDWGEPKGIAELLRVGRMKLAVLDRRGSGQTITAEVRRGSSGWMVAPFQTPPGMRYSNRLRIVHEVPAFAAIRRSVELQPDQRLVVLIPETLERRLDRAQQDVARRRGLALAEVENIGGRFRLDADRLIFQVTRVDPRAPHTPHHSRSSTR